MAKQTDTPMEMPAQSSSNVSPVTSMSQDTAAMDTVAVASSTSLFSRKGLFSNKALFIFALTAAAGFAAYKYRKEIQSYFYKPVTETKKRLDLVASDMQESSKPKEKETGQEDSSPSIEKTAEESMEKSDPSSSSLTEETAPDPQQKAPLTLEEFEHLTDEVDRDIGFDEDEQKALDSAIARQRAQEAAAIAYNLEEAPGSITLIQTSDEDVMPLRTGLERGRIEEMTSEQLSAPGSEELHDDDTIASVNSKRRRRR